MRSALSLDAKASPLTIPPPVARTPTHGFPASGLEQREKHPGANTPADGTPVS